MPREEFRLRRVLEHREREEDAAGEALASASRERGQQEERLHAVDRLREAQIRLASALLDKAQIDVKHSELTAGYLSRLEAERRRQERAARAAALEEARRRQLLLEAARRAEALRHLEQRFREQQAETERRRDRDAADEIGMQRAAWSRRHNAQGGAA